LIYELQVVRDIIVMLVLTLNALSHLALTGPVTARYAMHLVTAGRRSSSTTIYDLVTVKLGHLIKDDERKEEAVL
jgi:hypothetical protein